MKDKENLRQRLDEAIERAKAGLRLNLSGEIRPLTKQTTGEDENDSNEESGVPSSEG